EVLPLDMREISVVPDVTGESRGAANWAQTIVLDNNFSAGSAAEYGAEPHPSKIVITATEPVKLSDTLPQNLKALYSFSYKEAFMPSIPMYVQSMPRLCYRCRTSVTLTEKDYQWLQSKLSGVVERNYTVPEGTADNRPPGAPLDPQAPL